MQRAAAARPGQRVRASIYMWGTTGIGYNVDKVRKIDAGRAGRQLERWSSIRPSISKFEDCGVSVLDDPTDMMATALLYLGKDPNSEVRGGPARPPRTLLMKIRPYIRTITSSQYIDALANGDICLAVGYSGDMLQARDRAAEAGQAASQIEYAIPKEGALMWFDTLAIPADAPHPDNAHLFIDYLMRPEVAAKNSNFVNYANGNVDGDAAASNEAVRNDPSIYPTPEVKARLQPNLTQVGGVHARC